MFMIFEFFLIKVLICLIIFVSIFFVVLIFVIVMVFVCVVMIICDFDIEYLLVQFVKLILVVVGLGSNVWVLVIDDNKLNVFVVDNCYIFLYLGFILKIDSVVMLQVVIVYEVVYIVNGYIIC